MDFDVQENDEELLKAIQTILDSGIATPEDLENPEFMDDLQFKLEKKAAEESFYEFIKQAWRQVDTQDYVDNWHVEFICNVLQLVSEGKIKKLLINIPPGFAKTLLVTLWLSWDWINHPERYSIYATYAQPLSTKSAKMQRNLIRSDWFQERWGKGTSHNIYIDQDSTQKKQEFENNHKGGRFSTGKGGELTGRRGNFLVFDDLNKAQDASGQAAIVGSEIQKGVEFLSETMWSRRIHTRVEEKKSALVGICQRLHHADVAQWCIDQGDFVHICLPMECVYDERCIILKVIDESGKEKYLSALGDDAAEAIKEEYDNCEVFWEDPRENGEYLFPEILSTDEVEELKGVLGPIGYSAQCQQKPTPREGAKIDPLWFKRFSLEQMRETILDAPGSMIISVDGTFTQSVTSDYVVCQVWKEIAPQEKFASRLNRNYYLLDQWRGKTGVNGTIAEIKKLHHKFQCPKHIVIEKAANGYATIEMLEKLTKGVAGIKIVGFNPRTSKEGRVEAISPVIEEGRMWIPDDAPFDIDSLFTEIVQFPYGKNDDQVDAMSQAILYLTQGQSIIDAEKLRVITESFW